MKALFFFLFSTSLMAAPLDEVPCSSEIKALSKEWKSRDEWTKELMGGPESYFYASPTDEVGEWVAFRKIPEGVVISKISPSGRLEVAMKGKKCEKEAKPYVHDKKDPRLVGDEEIKKFVTTHKKGVIYVWSPRMVLSEKAIPEIQKATKKLKLPLLVLLDKDVSPKELPRLQKEYGKDAIKQVDALEFKMRRVGQHFPAMMVFKDSKILSGVKYGYEKSDRFELELTRMLGSSAK